MVSKYTDLFLPHWNDFHFHTYWGKKRQSAQTSQPVYAVKVLQGGSIIAICRTLPTIYQSATSRIQYGIYRILFNIPRIGNLFFLSPGKGIKNNIVNETAI
jgi:hypothetical protein